MIDTRLFAWINAIQDIIDNVGTYDYNEGGGDFQVKTCIDDEFKIPKERSNRFTYNKSQDVNGKYSILILGDNDTKFRIGAKHVPQKEAIKLVQKFNKENKVDGLRCEILLDGVVNDYTKYMDKLPFDWEVNTPYSKDYIKTSVDGKQLSDYVSETGINTLDKNVKMPNYLRPDLKVNDGRFSGYGELGFLNTDCNSYGRLPKTEDLVGTTIDNNFNINTPKCMRPNKGKNKNKLFSMVSMPNVDTTEYGLGNLIGTILESQMYAKLFHLQTYGNYALHMALDEYYENIGDEVDKLAESVLVNRDISRWGNEIYPKGNPMDYFSRVSSYITECAKVCLDLPDINQQLFQTNVDDIQNVLYSLLYKLRYFDSQVSQTKTQSLTFSEGEQRDKVPSDILEKAKKNGVVQQDKDGNWRIIDMKSGEFWNAHYQSKEKAEAALRAYHANKGFSFHEIRKTALENKVSTDVSDGEYRGHYKNGIFTTNDGNIKIDFLVEDDNSFPATVVVDNGIASMYHSDEVEMKTKKLGKYSFIEA